MSGGPPATDATSGQQTFNIVTAFAIGVPIAIVVILLVAMTVFVRLILSFGWY
jgi:capsular polysaccharide biosynthesis protein